MAMEIIRLRGLDRDWKKAADFIRRMWNDLAGHAGFPKLKKMTAARVSQVRAAIRDHGANQIEWTKAIQRYVDSAKAWPERKRYGFDSFIRAKNRDQWFEGAEPASDPSTMTQDEADAYYTEGL